MKDNVNIEIGKKIRTFRKKRGLTLDQFAAIIYKSKATVSKYEKGEISIDLNTLYEIADALDVSVSQLLYFKPHQDKQEGGARLPSFFDGITKFYGYFYDGRNKSILRMLFELLPGEDSHKQKLMMYMNFKDFDQYQICENTYTGTIEHYDALSTIQLTNKYLPLEKASVQILATSLDCNSKWGMWTGFSSRPMMPVSTKMLVSRERMKEDAEFADMLKISKEDIRQIKMYNMLVVL